MLVFLNYETISVVIVTGPFSRYLHYCDVMDLTCTNASESPVWRNFVNGNRIIRFFAFTILYFLGCLASVYAEDKFIEIAGVRLPGKDAGRVTDARKLRFIPEGSRAVQAHQSGVSAG